MDPITLRARFGSHLGLERITLLCQALGNPQNELRFVHVAGTNGKGSVCAFLASSLKAAGFKVGRFTSPHLVAYNERIVINDTQISDEDLSALAKEVDEACSIVETSHPSLGAVTEFEYCTALAFQYFRQQAVDIVVLETGLGGRLDATNIVTPELCVITPIGHDHMDRLGNTLQEIAGEKAGIIKEEIPVVVGFQEPEAYEVLRLTAQARRAPLLPLQEWDYQPLSWGRYGGEFLLSKLSAQAFRIKMLGAHQLDNAATAAVALFQLKRLGWAVSEHHVRTGLAEAMWPGRLEVVSSDPLVVLDGGHNREGLERLVAGLERLVEMPREGWTFVVGMLANKELDLLDTLLPMAKRFIFTQADSGRLPPMDPEAMAAYVRARGAKAEVSVPARDALQSALSHGQPICICGSLYLIGTIKRDLADFGIVTQ